MDFQKQRAEFDGSARIYEAAILRFEGVDGYDVYNCSLPFDWEGQTYLFGRVERRDEWATSWTRLFVRTGTDTYALVPDSMIYPLEDPYLQWVGGELVLGGTHVRKRAGEVDTYYAYFYRGTGPHNLRYFTTGPDYMKDIRLVPMSDGRVGVFSRPRNEEIARRYGSGSMIGFTVLPSLDALTAEAIEAAPLIDDLFGPGEWGGCNQCYLLDDGRIGVVGHKSYNEADDDGTVRLAVYTNVAFVFDPVTRRATAPEIIATRASFPEGPPKKPYLADCAFASGIVRRADGRVDLYSGIGDTQQGRVVIDDPFGGQW